MEEKEIILTQKRFKNPVFWLGILGVVFSATGVDFNTLTSWQLFGMALLKILENPVAVVSVIMAIYGIWHNPTATKVIKEKKNTKNIK